MSDPGDVLGIARDATMADIKRAYARALKANRPDDDPVAFGRVQAAYEACAARFKRQAAGIDTDDDWFDDDDDDDGDDDDGDDDSKEEGADPGKALPWRAARQGTSTAVLADASSPGAVEAAPGSPVSQVVEAIVEAAASMPATEFAESLRAEERLYDLSFKQFVGDTVIERASRTDLPWRALAAIHEFFEVDSVSDPRLRNDHLARQEWLRVQGDARFERRLRVRRGPNVDFVDRIVLAELFDPPDRRRHLMMHLVPTLSGQLRSRFKELSAGDPGRADVALSVQARDYWLPLTDPARLHWRRVALAFGHCAAATLPLALLIALPKLGGMHLLRIWAVVSGVLFAAWFLRASLSFAYARYSAWRLRVVGAGEVPAGANILADRVTVIAGLAATASVSVAIFAMRSGNTTSGLILQVWLVMAMIVVFRSPRFRWEALLAAAATAVCAYAGFRAIGAADLEEAFYGAAPGAFAAGALAVLLMDICHARAARLALADIRDAVSLPQCALAVFAALLAWFTR